MAPQSTMTNGLSARGPRWTISVATSSLPVPLSPSMSTLMSLGATFSSSAKSLRIATLVPGERAEGRDHRDDRLALRRRAARTRTIESPSESVASAGEIGVADAHAVEPRAVQRARVAHAPAAVLAHEAAVEARDRRVGEHEIVRRVRADAAEVAVVARRVRERDLPASRSTVSVRRGIATVSMSCRTVWTDCSRALGHRRRPVGGRLREEGLRVRRSGDGRRARRPDRHARRDGDVARRRRARGRIRRPRRTAERGEGGGGVGGWTSRTRISDRRAARAADDVGRTLACPVFGCGFKSPTVRRLAVRGVTRPRVGRAGERWLVAARWRAHRAWAGMP